MARPRCKRLWQQVVKAKINAQGRVLAETTGSDAGLYEIAKHVLSGDSNNREAVAGRRYWKALFGVEFKRDREARAALLEVTLCRVEFAGEKRTLFDGVLKMAQSLVKALGSSEERLVIPGII